MRNERHTEYTAQMALDHGKSWQEVLGVIEGNQSLRREIREQVPARAGPWDWFVMIGGGTLMYLQKIGHLF